MSALPTQSPARDAAPPRAAATSAPLPPGAILVDDGHAHDVRWRPGERLDHLFEAVCDRLREEGHADQVAVSTEDEDITYDALDARANALARVLTRAGVTSGDRVGLLFDRALPGYEAILAVLKLNAAYVPLDVGFPADRVRYIVEDAQVSVVLTESHLRGRLEELGVPVVCLDEAAGEIAAQLGTRLGESERCAPVDELCYVIYTSGSTGVPKGVPIEQASICNFVRVANEVYGVVRTDRMYQGMTIAFDFSIEEIWIGWMAGATLVPKPGKGALVGEDLRDFIVERKVTALSCVPTLLATIEEGIPGLRFLLVSGEACPQDLIARWWTPQRRFLNVYGPTEATVTATWTALSPNRRVTIGVPLPTYSVLILDPEETRALAPGEQGEIAIAGVALSPGYLNRPDQTARAFVHDVLGVPNNPSGLLYRTGDLGRVTDGEIEYLGRIDTQVKIRGYRIELTEIESVLLQLPGVAAAVVESHSPDPGVVELVAYVVRRRDTEQLDRQAIVAALRDRLPRYMVPAYIEELAGLPMLPSDKVDRKKLPPPVAGRVAMTSDEHVPPQGPLEQAMTDALAAVLRLDDISVTANFFDELSATSILMAAYCARLRQIPAMESVRISDLYLNPSVRLLAQAYAVADNEAGAATATTGAAQQARQYGHVSALRYSLCGLYQALFMAAYTGGFAIMSVAAFNWIVEATTYLETFVRSVAFVVGLAAYTTVVPILVKWVVIGRWKPAEIPAWTVAYLRFWTVRMLLRLNPMVFFVGSPLGVIYLRALGAKVGRHVVILTPVLPVCTDLLTIGSDTVISRDAVLNGYRAEAGAILTGPITIGSGVYVGAQAVLDIHTSLGDGAQLGHVSTLLPGQIVPAGQRWHGVPARPTQETFRRGPEVAYRRLSPFLFGLGQLVSVMLFLAAAIAIVVQLADQHDPGLLHALLGTSDVSWDLTLYELLLTATAVAFFGALAGWLLLISSVPRLLALGVRPGRVYPLYGVAYALHRTIYQLTNVRLFNQLFGDSSFVVGYLSRLGYRLKPVIQSGSNFGTTMSHETPYLSVVGSGTMVSDGLHFGNSEYTSSAFRVDRAALGKDNFLGNNIYLPMHAALGDNVLLATKVMVPLDGPPREGVGLLGSPCFEIPRTVGDDEAIVKRPGEPAMLSALRRKNRHNLVTLLLFLAHRLVLALILVVIAQAAFGFHNRVGWWAVPFVAATTPWLMAWWAVLVERAAYGFRRLTPRHVSIYDPYYWRHERYWKLGVSTGLGAFDGTPFKSWYLRGLGVRVGRRLLDDGCTSVEKTMVEIGDYCTLNYQSLLQGHSLENGVFKSDYIHVHDHVTIGLRAFVHYSTDLGEGSAVETDSFLMKGEQVPAGQRWQGNPAGPAPRAPRTIDLREVTDVVGAERVSVRQAGGG